MKFKYIISALFVAGLAVTGCNKDEEEEESKYVQGTLYFDIPTYAGFHEIITTSPYGCYHPDLEKQKDGTYRDSLGYYFTTSLNEVKDTVKRFTDPVGSPKIFTFEVPDTLLGQIIISAYAFAPDCYSASSTAYLQVVNPGYGEGHSLTGFNYDVSDPTVKIGERNYYVTSAGGSDWLRENVGLSGKGVGCSKADVMYGIFGGYYNYEEAAGICPEGWKLPSLDDFKTLKNSVVNVGDLYGDIYFNGNKMWTYWPEVKITDKTGMSVIPAGYATKAGDNFYFKDLYKKAVFWTSDTYDQDQAVACYFIEGIDNMYDSNFSRKDFYANVRCIKTK